jgi:hypothetical protein
MTDSLENIITEELTKSFTVVERFPERKYLLDEYSDRNDLSLEEALFTRNIVFLWEYEWVMIREEILDELITFLKTGKKSKKLRTLKHSETSCYKPVSKP